MLRRRFAGAGRIGANDVAEEMRKLQELENLAGERRRLVRADGHRDAEALEIRQSIFDIVEYARLLATDGVVPRLERLGRAVRNNVGVKRAAKQAFESLADELANCLGGQSSETVFAAREVHGIGERRVRVDQRSVEVEENRAITKLPAHRIGDCMLLRKGERDDNARLLRYSVHMKRALAILLLFAGIAFGEQPSNKLAITLDPLGDNDSGVVTRTTFRFAIPSDVPQGVPLVIIGSVTQGGQVVKRFRYPLLPSQHDSLSAIQTLQPGDAEVEARLMIPLEEQTPVIVLKNAVHFTIAKTNKPYVANAAEGAEAIVAEGNVPEGGDAVKIMPPRRDVAPNLFIVNVDVKPPVKRVEFWVEGKKIMTRNAPPYRAELDLGRLPKRVEVRAVGYDERGRYVDADAFVVNERETPLEVKLTRTQTSDRISHLKLSIQNPKNAAIKTVVLFADQKKFHEWIVSKTSGSCARRSSMAATTKLPI